MVNFDEGAVVGCLAVLGGYTGIAAECIPQQEIISGEGSMTSKPARSKAAGWFGDHVAILRWWCG